jgi:hypothetical protein
MTSLWALWVLLIPGGGPNKKSVPYSTIFSKGVSTFTTGGGGAAGAAGAEPAPLPAGLAKAL